MKSPLILTALMLGLAPGAMTLASPAYAQTAAAEAQVQRVTFVVENMSCALCPVTVKRAMERVDGARLVEIDLKARTATVVFDPDVTSAERIAAASTNAGYPATVRN